MCVCLAISLFLKKLGANLKFNIIKLKMFICVFFNQKKEKKKKKKKRKGLSVLNDETYKFLRGLRFYRDMKIFRVSNQMTNQ